MTGAVTRDGFLGGRVQAYQPATGYRAGVDPVLLAAAVGARAGQAALELGCGVGVASLCLLARVPGLRVTGVEVQPDYAALARRNADGVEGFEVVEADLRALPADLRQRSFAHVLMNPPYFDRAAGTASEDEGRDIAFGGETLLAQWIDAGARRVAPKGHLTLIQRIERLPEVLAALEGRLGSIIVRPIAGRPGRAPERFLLEARKEGRAPFRLSPPLVLHEGDRHEGDRESYTPELRAILRDGASLPLAPL